LIDLGRRIASTTTKLEEVRADKWRRRIDLDAIRGYTLQITT